MLTKIINNQTVLIVSLDEIAKYNPSKEMKNAIHYFNHISISPLSTGFIFLHLWDNNGLRSSRLFYYDLTKHIFNQITENPVAHYAWKNENELLVTEEYRSRYYYNLYNIKSELFIFFARR